MKARPEPDDNVVNEFIRQHGGDIAPREDIAVVFGCSRQRIEQIERKALRKIYIHLSLTNIWHLDDLT